MWNNKFHATSTMKYHALKLLIIQKKKTENKSDDNLFVSSLSVLRISDHRSISSPMPLSIVDKAASLMCHCLQNF